jgi:hypothetical protein
MRSAKGSR